MEWSSTAPTEAGWYWFRKYPKWEPVIIQITVHEKCGLLQDGWRPKMTELETEGKAAWCGPLLPPPKESKQPAAAPVKTSGWVTGEKYVPSQDQEVPFDES